jgi:hypothetical protein
MKKLIKSTAVYLIGLIIGLLSFPFLFPLGAGIFSGVALAPTISHAGGTSQYLSQSLLGYMFQAPGSPIAKPTTVYVALCTNTVTSTTACTEPSGNGYARVAVTASTGNWPITANSVANGAVITFPAATGSWSTITYFQIYDALTVGNPLWYGALTSSQTISSGATPSFAISSLSVQLN